MRWKAGQSGNPAGKPKGARNRMSESFLWDLYMDWQENGRDVIVRVREEHPDDYLKIVASLVPKDFNVRVGELDGVSTDDIARELVGIIGELSAAGGFALEGAAEAAKIEPPVVLSAVSKATGIS